MGISVDTSKQELLTQFAGFLEIAQDPKGFKEMLAKSQKQLDDSKALLGPSQTVEGADAYAKATKAKIDAAVEDHNKRVDQWEKDKADQQKQLDALKAEAAENLAEAVAAGKSAKDVEKALGVREEEVAKKEAAAMERTQSLDAREKSLNEQEEALRVKSLKLQDLLG